jgi:hypothetical protein
MTTQTNRAGWTAVAILAGRLIFAVMFIMAVSFKLMDIHGTAKYIAAAGFPLPTLLAWLAALLELAPTGKPTRTSSDFLQITSRLLRAFFLRLRTGPDKFWQ